MLGFYVQAQQDIINSVRCWVSHMGCVSHWCCNCLDIPSIHALTLSLHICRQGKLWVEWLGWCSNTFIGNLSCLQEMCCTSCIFPIARHLGQGHPHR